MRHRANRRGRWSVQPTGCVARARASSPNGGGSATTTSFGVGPRIGAYVPFGKHAGLWPKLGVSHEVGSTSVSPPPAPPASAPTPAAFAFTTVTTNVFALEASAPVIVDVAPHFFVGFGPTLSTQLYNSAGGLNLPKETTIGVELTLGGWV